MKKPVPLATGRSDEMDLSELDICPFFRGTKAALKAAGLAPLVSQALAHALVVGARSP